LILAMLMQLRWIPITPDGCDSYTGPESVALMWERAANSSDDGSSPSDICDKYQGDIILAMILIIVSLTTGVIGVLSPNEKVAVFMAFPIWLPLLISGVLLVGLFTAICYFFKGIWLLFKAIYHGVRFIPLLNQFVSERLEKSRQHKQENGLPVVEIVREKPPKDPAGSPTTLSRTSRHMRRELLCTARSQVAAETSQEDLSSEAALGTLACQAGTKKQCWACSALMCSGCQTTMEDTPQPQTREHFLCFPVCSGCHFRYLCEAKSGKTKIPCKHPRGADGNVAVQVCEVCAAKPKETAREAREKAEALELRHLARSSVRCGRCKRRLGDSGPSWWVRCECGTECTSEYHPHWRTRAKR